MDKEMKRITFTKLMMVDSLRKIPAEVGQMIFDNCQVLNNASSDMLMITDILAMEQCVAATITAHAQCNGCSKEDITTFFAASAKRMLELRDTSLENFDRIDREHFPERHLDTVED